MKTLLIILFSATVALVGCGKSGDKGGSSDSSVTINQKGEKNITLKEGDAISLFLEPDAFSVTRLTGQQINPSDVTYQDPNPGTGAFATGNVQTIKFIKIKGPDLDAASSVKLWSEGRKYGLLFTAPETKGAESVEYEYKIILINDKGAADESIRKITVLGVNDAPTFKVPAYVQTLPAQTVKLTAAEPIDIDGKITAYNWVQLSGLSVVLTTTNQANLDFVAPNSAKSENLEFQLTVTDNNGATSSQKVTVLVTPQNTPWVKIRFPAETAVTSARTLTVSGYAKAVKEAHIKQVNVKIGTDQYVAELDGTNWKVVDAPVPATGDTFEIIVSAEDNLGKIDEEKSVIKQSGSIVSEIAWNKLLGLDVDSLNGRLFAFVETGSHFLDYSVVSISMIPLYPDKVEYTFESSLTNTPNPEFSGNVSTAFNIKGSKYYIGTGSIINNMPASKIHAIDLSKDTASQLYPSESTQDVVLKSISGISADTEQLLIADGGQNKLFELELDKGLIKPLASQPAASDKVDYLALAPNSYYKNESPYLMPNSPTMSIFAGNLATNTLDTIAGPFADTTSAAKDLEVDENLQSAFMLDFKGDVYRIDLNNNTRTLYANGPIGQIAYDDIDGILYLYFTTTKSIEMVDVLTGESVEIVKSAANNLIAK